MKKIFLISGLGLILFLSECSQQLPTDSQKKNDKTSLSEQQLKEQQEKTVNSKNNQNSDTSTTDVSYQDTIDYVHDNITTIINSYFSTKPANDNWFAVGYGFTSSHHVYVDFEDGHFLYRALLECNSDQNSISSCTTLAILENQKQWVVIQGEDSQKDTPIVYKWAKDYEWQR